MSEEYQQIRLNEDGSLDEIVARNVDVHLEQMDAGKWWLGISRGEGEGCVILHARLWTKNGARIRANAHDEGLGCAIQIRDGDEAPWYREATPQEAKAKGWEGVNA